MRTRVARVLCVPLHHRIAQGPCKLDGMMTVLVDGYGSAVGSQRSVVLPLRSFSAVARAMGQRRSRGVANHVKPYWYMGRAELRQRVG